MPNLPYAANRVISTTVAGAFPVLRIGIPRGSKFHLKYLRTATIGAALYTFTVRINGIQVFFVDSPAGAHDIPVNSILPEGTQIRVDLQINTPAVGNFAFVAVGDMQS